MVRLIENGSCRFEHRAQHEVCQYIHGSGPHGLADTVEKLSDSPGQTDWTEATCASA